MLHNLSPLAKAGYIELVDGGNKSSCRRAYRRRSACIERYCK